MAQLYETKEALKYIVYSNIKKFLQQVNQLLSLRCKILPDNLSSLQILELNIQQIAHKANRTDQLTGDGENKNKPKEKRGKSSKLIR